MKRRQLLQSTFLGAVALSGLASSIAKAQVAVNPTQDGATCPPPPPPPAPPAIHSEISNNHKHDVGVIAYEDVIKDVERVINIKGQSSHSHTIELTAAVLEALRKQGVVDIESSVDAGHKHVVRLTRDMIPALAAKS